MVYIRSYSESILGMFFMHFLCMITRAVYFYTSRSTEKIAKWKMKPSNKKKIFFTLPVNASQPLYFWTFQGGRFFQNKKYHQLPGLCVCVYVSTKDGDMFKCSQTQCEEFKIFFKKPPFELRCRTSCRQLCPETALMSSGTSLSPLLLPHPTPSLCPWLTIIPDDFSE